MKSKLSMIVLLCWLGLLNQTIAMSRRDDDPLSRIRYSDAFDPKRFERFRDLMEHWGCAANVFAQEVGDALPIESASEAYAAFGRNVSNRAAYQSVPMCAPVADEDDALAISFTEQERQFRQLCLAMVRRARRDAVMKLAYEAGSSCCCVGSAATLGFFCLGPSTLGGSDAAAFGLLGGARDFRDVIQAFTNLFFQPPSPLDQLEQRYALEQCFIPRALWPMIKDKFTLARTNQLEQRACTDFIEFALGLTSFKPQHVMNGDVSVIKNQIFEKIDAFFQDYEKPGDCAQLKVSVGNFIQAIIDGNAGLIQCHYLVGAAGIGKSYFVQKLKQWLEQALVGSIYFENIVVSSPAELEGDAQHPGVFLRALRNQLQADCRGICIFMDEASWLNDKDWISSAKRVFNGSLSSVSTRYFGGGSQGTGFALALPPALIFVANNDAIEDGALRSRFTTIKFPMPKAEALVSHAHKLFGQSSLKQVADYQGKTDAVRQALRDELVAGRAHISDGAQVISFRDVERFTEPFAYQSLYLQ